MVSISLAVSEEMLFKNVDADAYNGPLSYKLLGAFSSGELQK